MKKSAKGKNNLPVIVVAVMSLICITVIGLNILDIMGSEVSQTPVQETIENKFYTIKDNATKYQKDLFDELTIALDKNENKEEIVGLVAKSFVADLFTWTNKDGNYDVGGTQYVYGNANKVFKTYAMDTLYGNYDLIVTQYGKDYLPEVASVTTDVYAQTTEFTTYFGSYPFYYVYVSWEYKVHEPVEGSESKVVDTSTWKNSMDLYIVEREDGRFEVVEFY